MTKEVDPAISKFMSDAAKKRKNPYYGFKDKARAKAAGEKGRETQRKLREASQKPKTTES